MSTTDVPTKKRISRKIINNFKKTQRHYLMTSRFNNSTWTQNEQFREANNKQDGCVYCAPDPISSTIPMETVLFVLEMNNDTNRIMGVGMVRNHAYIKKYAIYSDNNYNRYIYSGSHRIDRSVLNEEEEQVFCAFDILCFKGNKHMKRGQGIKSFPTEILYNCSREIDLVGFISKMFKRRIECKKTNCN